jgi:DNA repair protein RadC
MKEHYHGHRDRLKKRFCKEPESLYDYELLELLLGYVLRGRDVKPQAKELLEDAGSLTGIFGFDASSVKGLGAEADIFFRCIKEFYARIGYEGIQRDAVVIENPEKAANFLKMKIGFESKEHLIALFMDVNKNLLGYKVFSKGTVNKLTVFPREIAEEALNKKATFVIMAHNHPSGNLTPSEEDIKLTDKVSKALAALDINLADHIIISRKGYYSFKLEQII